MVLKVLCFGGCTFMATLCMLTGQPETAHPYIAAEIVIVASGLGE